MADCQITCITKPDPENRHEHITHVGNPPTWIWPTEKVIQSIESGLNSFFVKDASGKVATVRVVRSAGRRPFIQTYADGVPTDNLLHLVQCPR